MDIILISHSRGQTWRLRVAPRSPWVWAPLVTLPLTALVAAAWLGYWVAPNKPLTHAGQVAEVAEATQVWDDQIAVQRRRVKALRNRVDDNVEALTRRLGKLQAKITRLDAAGSRMTKMAGLSKGEFDFDSPPPIGGPEIKDSESTPTLDQFKAALNGFSDQLDSRERQMRVLRDLMVASKLHQEVMPSGRPVNNTWISSPFGWRTDPFNGKREFHPGDDFAVPLGTKVTSVAAGVVTFAGRDGGYGKMVEINHGNGYVTRYGHNSKILVHVGERVNRGQMIAKSGSTGRSTGPHVHFEVRHNGRVVSPAEYIQAAR